MLRRLLPRKSAAKWLKAGDTQLELDQHFTIERKLGTGSFATVYAARRHVDGQLYALKVMDVKALKGPEEQADAVNEVRRRAADTMHFSEEQIWATLLQAALGLQYLHHNHILHRDLKPQNLLVTEGGGVKLADLGISALLDRVFARSLVGTPHYIAPEMWRRQPYSYSADVWALGCILHELCTLRPLFYVPGGDAAVRDKVLSGDVPPPIPARYSPQLQSLVNAMLQQAQRQLVLLPPEIRRRCISPAVSGQQDLARFVRPIQVPKGSADWELLNEMMPTPRYPTGSSVSGALRRAKDWKSTGDLRALGAASAADSDDDSSVHNGASLHAAAVDTVAGMRKSISYGSLAAAAEAAMERSSSSLLRRKSVNVGQLLHSQPAGSGGGSAGSGGSRFGRESAGGGDLPRLQHAPGRGEFAVQPRSKSISVESAVEVLRGGGSPLPELDSRRSQQLASQQLASQQQQQQHIEAGAAAAAAQPVAALPPAAE
ncbi:kinase-like [Micractinium conductrix]|uniref:non-specific serine/threonine protein kinase n=1 Tax=Micractinium conductrix TaxID=554055 RepID=A0A2P6VSL6_9CHLO|nr:kinase-like [Micractinium conductrix]|eukprot:PSC77050.1 kinase-like [Micractinium conductrix]